MSKTYTLTLTLPNGKRKYYRGSTRREAEEKRAKDQVAIGQGIAVGDNTTFFELASLWFELYKKDNLHKRSSETILDVMERYVLPVLGGMQVQDIRPLHIQRLMSTVSCYSNSTQKKVLQYTKAVLRVAVDNRLIPSSPVTSDIKAKGKPPEEVTPLTNEQCQELLESCKGTRAYLFLMVLLFAGLRKGEALGLMWKDIDFKNKTLTVNQSIVYPKNNRAGEINTDLKTDNAHRTIPLVAELETALLAESKKKKGLYVFHMADNKFLSESSFRRMWDVVERRVDFKVHPHQLRHTCATRWVRNGVPPKTVQYLLGHSTIDITMEIYTHYEEEIQRAETAKILQEAMPAFASTL